MGCFGNRLRFLSQWKNKASVAFDKGHSIELPEWPHKMIPGFPQSTCFRRTGKKP